MSVKVYLAGRFTQRPAIRLIRNQLQNLGIDVTSGWLDEHESKPFEDAQRDFADIDRSDALVLVTHVKQGKGMWVELGYALAKGKPCFLYPDPIPACIFTALPGVRVIPTIDELVEVLKNAKR